MVGTLNCVELVLSSHSEEENNENSSPNTKSTIKKTKEQHREQRLSLTVRRTYRARSSGRKRRHSSSSSSSEKENFTEVQASSVEATRQRRHSARLTTTPCYRETDGESEEDDDDYSLTDRSNTSESLFEKCSESDEVEAPSFKRKKRRRRRKKIIIEEKSPSPSKTTAPTVSAITATEDHAETENSSNTVKDAPKTKKIVNWDDFFDQCVFVKKIGGNPVERKSPEKKLIKWKPTVSRKSVASSVKPGEDCSKASPSSHRERDRARAKQLTFHTVPDDFKYAKPDSEAERGDALGSFISNKFPAIPTRKFAKKDVKIYGDTKEDWTVQAVYPTSDPRKYLVIYEGWASHTGSILPENELEETAAEMLTSCKQRMKIIEALEKKTGNVYNHDVVQLQSKPRSGFWTMEDITYFHSNYHIARRLAPIYYMTDNPQIQKFPTHVCIFRNVIHPNARELLKRNPKGKSIDVVREEMRSMNDTLPIFFKKSTNPCPSKECKCDVREDYVYQNNPQTVHSERLNYDKSGKLIVEECETRYLIECSDICKCDQYCPARTVQRGQQVPLVITFEDKEKGFGVRAGDAIESGQFIAEYTGLVRLLDDETCVNENYLAECHAVAANLSIDALEKGNVSRFINHSCSPNSMFIEVHSRAHESSLLVPRVAVFATKRIEMGEEITISYYNKLELKYAAERKSYRTSCRCKSENCLGWLPTRK